MVATQNALFHLSLFHYLDPHTSASTCTYIYLISLSKNTAVALGDESTDKKGQCPLKEGFCTSDQNVILCRQRHMLFKMHFIGAMGMVPSHDARVYYI